MTKRLLLGAAATAATAALLLQPAAAQAAAPKPVTVSGKLFKAWVAGDEAKAHKYGSPSAVKTLFAYPYRTPDVGPKCYGKVCDFAHTSVTVPGALNGIRMIVSGSKVVKVYTSRHLTKPSHAAKWLYKAYLANDKNAAMEVASFKAITQQFKAKYQPGDQIHQFMGCEKEPKGYICHWYYEGGAANMHVRGSKIRGYYVDHITYVAD
ncbi:hypothetical protein ACIBH1_05950 [Nonomuraea sp. NPDC050663]|uniref:hypothetical protein n=1 Tax=Nonomuraea sp. NPDC050663 TaxID=3364370 RepID=UPI0037BA5475